MKVEIIDKCADLGGLEKDWNQLLTSSGQNCVFLTFEWLTTFVRSFELEDKLMVVLIKEGHEVVGILPLYKARARIAGITCDVLKSISNVHTPKYDFIVKTGSEEVVENVLVKLKNYHDWDLMELDYVDKGSQLLKTLSANTSIGRNTRIVPVMRSPFLDITCGWEDYYHSLSKQLVKNIDKCERRAIRDFGIELEIVNGSLLSLETLLEAFTIEDRGWKGSQGSSIMKNAKVRAFYQSLALYMNQKGWFDLLFLNFGKEKVAFDYCLKYNSAYSPLKTGYDEEYKKYSPGMILRKMEIRNVFSEGFRRYDFLGKREDYKVKMANRDAVMSRVFIFGSGVKSRLLKAVMFEVPELAGKMRIRKFLRKLGVKAKS